MTTTTNSGRMLSTVQNLEQTARSIFELPQQKDGIEGYIENQRLFSSVAISTIRLSEVVHKSLDVWKKSVSQREKILNTEAEACWKKVMAALASLTGFLLERANPAHPDGGFALRPSPRCNLVICRDKATRILNNWITPSLVTPVVHQEVILSPEGVKAWEEAMSQESTIGKPISYKPRHLEVG